MPEISCLVSLHRKISYTFPTGSQYNPHKNMPGMYIVPRSFHLKYKSKVYKPNNPYISLNFLNKKRDGCSSHNL